ncbi:MAG: CRISPR-associated endoribonuclease Cas6 [candidate division WOR-3 bacterium]|nr:CRISPR-associated endoribonuclease Cas6 [candidate division WOR-3 bacterium]
MMKINVSLVSESAIKINKDYRRVFISLIKRAFSNTEINKEIISKKEYKPYTFSVWLGDKIEIEDKKIKTGNIINFTFSSGDPVVITNFYNGILVLKGNKIPISNDASLTITDINLLPYRRINTTKVLFKTIGVSVLNDPQAPKKDFKKWYIIPTDDLERFNQCLIQRTNSRYQFLTGRAGVHKIEMILPYEIDNPIKETIVKHYEGNVRGFRGVFWLEGSLEILQFVYDYGLGIRTGQGFGMLEILKMGD